MRLSRFLKSVTVGLAIVGLTVPNTHTISAADSTTSVKTAEQAKPLDVSLNASGKLVGQVVDHQGTPRVNSVVTVATMQGQVVQKVTTNEKGLFSADVTKGGVYVVSGTVAASPVRVWTQNAAPPSANTGVLIVDDAQAARGQVFTRNDGSLRWGVILVTGAIVGGVITAVAEQNAAS